MNYNPGYNNPQQNWNQPPVPAPKPPKNNTKWVIIISLAVVIVFGTLFYVVAYIGRSMGSFIGNASSKIQEIDKTILNELDKSLESSNSEEYYNLIDEISEDSLLADSLKIKLTNNLSELRKNARATRELIKLYEDGFNDTLPNRRKYSSYNTKWSNAYFIKTGRAANLKNSLENLMEQTFNNLPDTTQSRRFVNILDIYDNSTAPDYLKQSTSWENTHFDQPSDKVRMNFGNIRTQIYNFEKAVLEHYREYFLSRNW